MAPRLAASTHQFIEGTLHGGEVNQSQIAEYANCTRRSVTHINRNIRIYGTTTAPTNAGGRPRTVTEDMLDELCEFLVGKPDLLLEEMVIWLWDKFGILPVTSTVGRRLKAKGWSSKVARQTALQRNPDLVDFYLYTTTNMPSWQRVYVDESGMNRKDGFRRTGWAPVGVTPVKIAQFQRERRYQILPAYTQDGFLTWRVFQGTTDGPVFEDFIKQLLHHCEPWPGRNSVLIMDNARIHRSPVIDQSCANAGVKLIYLPPYCPHLNPVEEKFSQFKAVVKHKFPKFERDGEGWFRPFLEECISMVAQDAESARGHFRHAGVTVTDFDPSLVE